jgi:L-fucose mutarotase
MLKGLDPLLTPELLRHLSGMGHGEWVAVVDANFTADWLARGRPVVRLPGHDLARVTCAVLSVLPLADDVAQPAGYMQHGRLPEGQRTPAQQAFVDMIAREPGLDGARVEAIERHEFYRRVEGASLIVQTGEPTAYGNAILCKGVICPPDGR